jgi:hypothetical protein
LLKRVFQIVFEIASCARQDQCDEESIKQQSDVKLPVSLSLKTTTDELFPDTKQSTTHINFCEVIIRSILLRAQYGGMKFDCQMLYSYAITWLRRFQLVSVPTSLEKSLSTVETTLQTIHWWEDVPQLLHSKARVHSEELITSKLICSNGIPKLTAMDVCSAGIDFHCSRVVEHLLSQRELYIILSERLSKLKSIQVVADREWISDQLKSMIWNFSSGVNHRRFLLESQSSKVNDTEMKAIWNEVVKQPFDIFTKKFVRDRLAFY